MLIGDDQDQIETPWLTMALIAVCCLVFAAQLYWGRSVVDRFAEVPAILTGAVPQFPSKNVGLPTIFTSAFLHGNPFHLLGNMWFLWMFGRRIEDSFGRLMMLCFIVICQVAASAAQTFAGPDLLSLSLGASGFVAGLMGAFVALFPTAKIRDFEFANFFFFGRYTVAWPAWVWVGIWVAFQIFALSFGSDDGIGHAAHVGGFVAGFVVSRLLHVFGIAATYAPAAARPITISREEAEVIADAARGRLLFGRVIFAGGALLTIAAYATALTASRNIHLRRFAAAAGENATAAYYLANGLLARDGQRAVERAIDLYRQAATADQRKAKYALAATYWSGRIGALDASAVRNPAEAIHLNYELAERQDRDGLFALAFEVLHDPNVGRAYIAGTVQLLESAARDRRPTVEPWAQGYLALFYARGVGVVRDPQIAQDLASKARAGGATKLADQVAQELARS